MRQNFCLSPIPIAILLYGIVPDAKLSKLHSNMYSGRYSGQGRDNGSGIVAIFEEL